VASGFEVLDEGSDIPELLAFTAFPDFDLVLA
jgi:hypothetical protein